MGYVQSGVKSPQVPFNDSLACSEHLQWHLRRVGDQIGAASRWSPPHRRLGQPGRPLCASCSSLLLLQFLCAEGILLPHEHGEALERAAQGSCGYPIPKVFKAGLDEALGNLV